MNELEICFGHQAFADPLLIGGYHYGVEIITQHHHFDFEVLPDQQMIRFDFNETYAPGDIDSFTVEYQGEPKSSGFGSFEQSDHNGNPVLWTLSEPYGAKAWWPCKQDLRDKIDSLDVFVTTNRAYKAASNGTLISSKEIDNDKVIYHWQHRYPITTYLVAIAVTNYEQFEAYSELSGGDSVYILNYIYPENLANAEAHIQSTVSSIRLYSDLFGDYPFKKEKYGLAEFGWGGGMEHQTMSFMGGFSHLLQAHELAHQWFGDKVTCGSWEDIWLNEGFATYLEGLTAEHDVTGNNRTFRNWLSSNIGRATQSPNGSVFVDDTTSVGRIFSGRLSYSKGAMVLHMLRWTLGDDDFFQGVRNYIQDPDIAYQYARTADLKRHLEMQSGINLDEYFDDWFYGQGYPSYHLTWQQEGNEYRLKVDQTTSNASVDFFEMKIPVRVIGTNGEEMDFEYQHNYSGEIFIREVDFTIDTVEFDPDLWLITKNNTVRQDEVSGIADPTQSSVIYPNPFSDYIQINTEYRGEMRLINSMGKTVLEIPAGTRQVDVKKLNQGLYVLIIGDNRVPLIKN